MPEPITRTILEKFDVPDGRYETVIMHVEIAPQVNSGLHTHPGFDAAYLLEGDLTVGAWPASKTNPRRSVLARSAGRCARGQSR